jgi:hypothetical protein
MRAQHPPCPWDAEACRDAAFYGQLEVLQWLRAQHTPCPWGASICQDAAAGGHLDVLRWLRTQEPPCPWNARACSGASFYGHLEVLQWLRAQHPPCPWNADACRSAAHEGHLDMLQWLRAQDPPCPWDIEACLEASAGKFWGGRAVAANPALVPDRQSGHALCSDGKDDSTACVVSMATVKRIGHITVSVCEASCVTKRNTLLMLYSSQVTRICLSQAVNPHTYIHRANTVLDLNLYRCW